MRSTQSFINLKRENFHVGIRKIKREEDFKLKRQLSITGDIQSYQLGSQILMEAGIPIQSHDILQQISGLMRTLETYMNANNIFDKADHQVDVLHQCLKYLRSNTAIILDGFLYNFLFNLLELCLYHRKSFMHYDDEEEQLRWTTIQIIIEILLSASYNSDDYGIYYLNKEELILDLFGKSENEHLCNTILSLICNITFDDKTSILELLKRDIIQKVVTKTCELQIHLKSQVINNVQFLFCNLSGRYDSIGERELNTVFHYLWIVSKHQLTTNQQQSVCYLVMRNLTHDLSGQRSQQVMRILIDLQFIEQACTVLLSQEEVFMNSGWDFLLNLSYINDNAIMKVLVDSSVLMLISIQINTVLSEQIQINLYMVLANLFASNIFIKDNIIQYGLTSRIVSGFEMALDRQHFSLLEEITYCINNAIGDCSLEQLDYFYKNEMLDCATCYLTKIEKQNMSLVEELIGVLVNLLHFSEPFLQQCQLDRQLQYKLTGYIENVSEKLSQNAQNMLDLIQK